MADEIDDTDAGPIAQPSTPPEPSNPEPNPEPTPQGGTTQAPAPEDNKPNVKLAPSKEALALSEGHANIGMLTIDIPDVETQLVGFHTPHASALVNQFPQYKYIRDKGPTSQADTDRQENR